MNSVGINFGAIFSSVAVIQNDRGEVVADSAGHRQLPSIVTYSDVRPCIGEEAKKIMAPNPKSTISDLSLLLSLSIEESQNHRFEFPLVLGKNGKLAIKVQSEGKEIQIRPHDPATLVFQQLKKTAEDAIGVKTSKVVFSVAPNTSHEIKESLIEILRICRKLSISTISI